ncbi:MAG TPA: hypothetical protein V6C89_11140 [Drouetiella sp.]|jgi:hypothetical protein
MNEEEKAKWRAEAEAGARAFGGRFVTDEELQAMYVRLWNGSPPVHKYPESNATEMAMYTDDGGIAITHVQRDSDGSYGHGTQVYMPGDKNFEYYWKRHDSDNRKTKTHVIIQRFDETIKNWIDLGSEWI